MDPWPSLQNRSTVTLPAQTAGAAEDIWRDHGPLAKPAAPVHTRTLRRNVCRGDRVSRFVLTLILSRVPPGFSRTGCAILKVASLNLMTFPEN